MESWEFFALGSLVLLVVVAILLIMLRRAGADYCDLAKRHGEAMVWASKAQQDSADYREILTSVDLAVYQSGRCCGRENLWEALRDAARANPEGGPVSLRVFNLEKVAYSMALDIRDAGVIRG